MTSEVRRSESEVRNPAFGAARALLVMLVLLGSSCPRRPQVINPTTAEEALVKALVALEARRFREAEERFTFVIFNFPGSREAADAQFYLAETYFRGRDYQQAQTEYDFYLKSFPNARFQEEATYKLALSYYRSAPERSRDQTRTNKALEILEEFAAQYPGSELLPEVQATREDIGRRLSRREFDIALLYFKAGEFRSALIYYEAVAVKLPAEGWDGRSRYRMAVCYRETGQPEKARPILEQLANGDYPPQLKRLAEKELSRLN